MEQDLRKLFEKERKKEVRMKEGHETRFLERLEEELPREQGFSKVWVWTIAASVLVLVAAGTFFFTTNEAVTPVEPSLVATDEQPADESISLGDLSPDLAKVENYYLANIQLELSKLEVSPANKELVDSFLEQLEALDQEYNYLNKELNTLGPNDQTITALIKNLQLRLQLLLKLKEKLNQIKSSKNEQLSSNHV